MKYILTLLSILLLQSCGNTYPLSNQKKRIVPPIIIEEPLTCGDFNADNHGSELPCVCSPQYFLSLDTKDCIDKNVFPKFYITIENNNPLLKETYQNAILSIDANQVDTSWSAEIPTKIKGRGNSTWEFPKKPFRLKLGSAASILGLPKHKDWVLLANWSDKTLLRVMLANEMGKRLKMDYSPRYRVVEVYINNSYRGAFLLTEQLKIDENRINISDADITGGYLLELDQYRDGDVVIESNKRIPFVLKDPDDPSLERVNYINDYVNHLEDVLFSNNFTDEVTGYSSLIDVDSFSKWYLINEILKNSDAANFSSIYYHKSAGEKLKMGPIWDFDTSSGNNNYTDAEFPDGWWIRERGVWFNRLFDDPEFEENIKNMYNNLHLVGLDKRSIMKFIDQKARALEFIQRRNFTKWGTMGIYVWPNPIVFGTYQEEVDYMKDWLSQRMDWIEGEFSY